MTRLSTRIATVAGLWLAMAVATPSAAAPEQVDVIYLVAYAHNEDAEFDRRLAPVKSALQTLGFSGYAFVSTGKWSMGVGDSRSVNLDSGYTLQIHLDEIADEGARLTVWLTRPDKSDPARINLKIKPNAVVVFGGTDYKQGKLVVPIRVKYP